MQKISKRVFLVNCFGTFGYMLSVLSWSLLLGVFFLILSQSMPINVSGNIAEPAATSGSGETSAAMTYITYGLAAVMALVSVAIIVALPYFIGKFGSKLIRTVMQWLKIEQTKRQLFLMKCVLATLPLVGFFAVTIFFPPLDLAIPAAHITAIVASVLAMVSFLMQLFLARKLRVDAHKIW